MLELELRSIQPLADTIPTVIQAHREVRLALVPARSDSSVGMTDEAGRIEKSYRRLPFIPLAKSNEQSVSLSDALNRRRSAKQFESTSQITLETLASILSLSVSEVLDVDGTPHRAYPSAGARYPVEIYMAAMRVSGLPAGLYRYDPVVHGLNVLLEYSVAENLKQITCDERILECNIAFILTSAFYRSCLRYGGRGYRYSLIEAGAVAQNIDLCCRGHGLGAVWLGGFADEQANELLDINLDLELEAPVLMIAVGQPRDPKPI
jgi:SagB-type dehydrogenase family enzyme